MPPPVSSGPSGSSLTRTSTGAPAGVRQSAARMYAAT